jgi:hypothetical protein
MVRAYENQEQSGTLEVMQLHLFLVIRIGRKN